jgi:hypothetical protein
VAAKASDLRRVQKTRLQQNDINTHAEFQTAAGMKEEKTTEGMYECRDTASDLPKRGYRRRIWLDHASLGASVSFLPLLRSQFDEVHIHP